jgi:hypothetical protein
MLSTTARHKITDLCQRSGMSAEQTNASPFGLEAWSVRRPSRMRQTQFRVATGWETPRARRCECGAADCGALIYMTWDEQDRADHAPQRWAIARGHIPRGAARWRVVEESDRFVIVEIDEHEPSPA